MNQEQKFLVTQAICKRFEQMHRVDEEVLKKEATALISAVELVNSVTSGHSDDWVKNTESLVQQLAAKLGMENIASSLEKVSGIGLCDSGLIQPIIDRDRLFTIDELLNIDQVSEPITTRISNLSKIIKVLWVPTEH